MTKEIIVFPENMTYDGVVDLKREINELEEKIEKIKGIVEMYANLTYIQIANDVLDVIKKNR